MTLADDPADGPADDPAGPRFAAQLEAVSDFPIYDRALLRAATEDPDFAILSRRELAELAASYTLEAIACEALAPRLDAATREGETPEGWREWWASEAFAARIAAQCCRSYLKRPRFRR